MIFAEKVALTRMAEEMGNALEDMAPNFSVHPCYSKLLRVQRELDGIARGGFTTCQEIQEMKPK